MEKLNERRRKKSLASLIFSMFIVLGGMLVLQPFLLPILWAAIIATSSWPLHYKIYKATNERRNIAALISTVLIGSLLVIPLLFLLLYVVQDLLSIINFLIEADNKGIAAPVWVKQIPFIGEYLQSKWLIYLAEPDQLSGVVHELLTARLSVIQTATERLANQSGMSIRFDSA